MSDLGFGTGVIGSHIIGISGLGLKKRHDRTGPEEIKQKNRKKPVVQKRPLVRNATVCHAFTLRSRILARFSLTE